MPLSTLGSSLLRPCRRRGATPSYLVGWCAALLACLLPVACDDGTASGDAGPSGGGASGTGSGGASGPPFDLPVYIQPTVVCRPPVEGEGPGASEGGQVCTWQSVAGATEEGRRFRDYADCAVVRTQRPYYPMPPSETYQPDDPRLQDAAYASELGWVRAQIDATGCSCCHSTSAPRGPVRWSIDLPGNWMTSFSDRDLALLANWVDTSMFEKFPADTNNGFSRPHGLPSTDPARIEAFFVAEAKQRGLTREQFADAPPTGGHLLDLAAYKPGRCGPGEGLGPGNTLAWVGGPARYVHVLGAASKNPGVPPDRDTPAGTLWRLDVPPDGEPLLSGSVRYGEVPPGTKQTFPSVDAPAVLDAGQDYYLYVTRDMFQPLTRCIFTASP